mgnify:CR=1 FL=1
MPDLQKMRVGGLGPQWRRAPIFCAILGVTTSEKSVKLFDSKTDSYPVNVPLSMLFGDLPITDMTVSKSESVDMDEIMHPNLNLMIV